jgi:hypothetical protein
MVDVVNRPVHEISGLSSGGAGYTYTGQAYDFAIGGIPFLAANSNDTPYVRKTGPYRKEQMDETTEPGEQSLSYWWLRSQSSFHGGAGQEFLDGQAQTEARQIKFKRSLGADIWTPGQVGLLKDTASEVTGTGISAVIPASATNFIYAEGAALRIRNTATNTTTLITTAAGTINALTSDGVQYYYSTTNGIYRGPLDNSSGPVQAYTTQVDALAFVKARVVAANDDRLYELSSTASAAALPAAFYDAALGSTVFEHFAEGGAGFYVAARNGLKSYILLVTVDTTTATLTAPSEVAVLPDGETVQGLYGYLNSFLGICTSKGFRVATLDSNGSLTYGPLTFESTGCRGIVGGDRFLYVGVSDLGVDEDDALGTPGLIRVDLGQENEPGRYAYATDLQFATTTTTNGVTAVTTVGDYLVALVDNGVGGASTDGIFMQADTYVSTAYLVTSKIRYSTTDDKLFRFLRVSADSGDMTCGGSTIDPQGRSLAVVTVDTGAGEEATEGVTRIAPAEYVSISFAFVNSDTASTGYLRGYQLKALPAQKRQREFSVPVLVYDFEKDRTGQRSGFSGWAAWRLEQLEGMEEQGDEITFQHIVPESEEALGRSVVIDSIEFRQTTVPNQTSSMGGIAVINLRTLS